MIAGRGTCHVQAVQCLQRLAIVTEFDGEPVEQLRVEEADPLRPKSFGRQRRHGRNDTATCGSPHFAR